MTAPDAVPVPPALRRGSGATDDGAAWLTRLPDLVDRARSRWGLRLEAPFPAGTTAWTAPARTADGTDAVVKIVCPHPEAAAEAAGLRAWAGRGAVDLLDHDAGTWTLLLRRARPGHGLEADPELAERRPAVRVDLAAELLGRLHTVDRAEDVPELTALAADQAALLRERAQRFTRALGADPGLLTDAAALLEELPRGGRRALLHGDLNPGNVLADDAAGRRRWLAVDPKPVLGDAAFDAWPVLAQVGDPFAEEDPVSILRAHAAVLCATAGLETDRVGAWALARSCESALWRAAEQGDRDGALAELARARAWARLL